MLKHPLVRTLFSLRGNVKACVLTEPLWGIPFSLYAPYVSVYMLALGLTDGQIGFLLSLNMAFQILGALLGGAITDKLGRRKTTFIFDIVSWSIPTLLWAIAQDFRYFVVAAVINGMWRITHTSWSCLMVEDAEPEQLLDIYSWVYIAGLLGSFFAPVAGLLIATFTLVPTVRGLYLFACVVMTLKCIILYIYSTETRQGEIRLRETKGQNLFSLVTGYGDVLKQMLRTPSTMFTLGIILAMNLSNSVNNTFWSILVTQRLQIPSEHIALYPFARSIIMLFFFFMLQPWIKKMKFRNPMVIGFMGLAASQLLLITMPAGNYLLLLLATVIEGFSYPTVSTQIDRMTVVTVDPQERSRIMALLFLVVLILSTPFGWIAGQLSEINRILPFVLTISLFLAGSVLVVLAARRAAKEENEQPAEVIGVS